MVIAKRNAKKWQAKTQILLFLIWLTSFGHDWKAIKKQTEKCKVYVYEKCYTDKKLVWNKYFPWISWVHYGKIMLRLVLFPIESQKPNHYFHIFFSYEILKNRLNQTSLPYRTSFNIMFWDRMFLNQSKNFLEKLKNN